MLSDKDRHTLAEIERQLEREDAVLVAALRGQARAQRRARLRHDLTIAVAGLLALICLLLPGAAGPGLLAAVLAIVTFAIRRKRFGPLRSRAGGRRSGLASNRPARRWPGRRPL